MDPLTEYHVEARPDRCIVQVYDADAYLGDTAAMRAAEVQVVAGNGYHLYFKSLQPDIEVTITIRVWDQPHRPPAHAEGSVPVDLESATGTLVVNQLSLGPAGMMELPRPGVYAGHAWWINRESTLKRYETALVRLTEEDSADDALRQAFADSAGHEQYVLDLHFVRESEDEDEDEEED
ncbi:hypothetical protein [Streptomyces katsurahamanus]|uniref:Uncharacterized protein n=1 Tax=Streptomyces katsurahamanus TaxID=2577098 RepID=A0ABW9NYT2_9ACTN|nr:hypothetical protein [Streptomyces katsurahamanus]MQS38004.1 hypothetical protein [Streptomyces katsurahamanus]